MIAEILFVLVLVLVFLCPFIIFFVMCGFDWFESIMFSVVSFGIMTSLVWFVGGGMLLSRAVFWAVGLLYLVAGLSVYTKLWGWNLARV